MRSETAKDLRKEVLSLGGQGSKVKVKTGKRRGPADAKITTNHPPLGEARELELCLALYPEQE